MPDKWTLNIGCHCNTITSRDSTSEPYDSREEAYSAYRDHKKFYRSIGYVVWFAEIVAPDGSKETLEQNPCYS